MSDLERGTHNRLTALEKEDHAVFKPIWTPDDKRIVFATNVSGKWDIHVRAADGTGDEGVLLDREGTQFPDSYSPDGVLLYAEEHDDTAADLWTMRPGEEPQPFAVTSFDEWASRFSPDGELVAYASTESGRSEVYVRPFPGLGERHIVSTEGGEAPVWSPDGKRLYYSHKGEVWAVQVQSRSPLKFGRPSRLFRGEFDIGNWSRFSMDAAAERFLIVLPLPESIPDRLRIVTAWSPELAN